MVNGQLSNLSLPYHRHTLGMIGGGSTNLSPDDMLISSPIMVDHYYHPTRLHSPPHPSSLYDLSSRINEREGEEEEEGGR